MNLYNVWYVIIVRVLDGVAVLLFQCIRIGVGGGVENYISCHCFSYSNTIRFLFLLLLLLLIFWFFVAVVLFFFFFYSLLMLIRTCIRKTGQWCHTSPLPMMMDPVAMLILSLLPQYSFSFFFYTSTLLLLLFLLFLFLFLLLLSLQLI